MVIFLLILVISLPIHFLEWVVNNSDYIYKMQND